MKNLKDQSVNADALSCFLFEEAKELTDKDLVANLDLHAGAKFGFCILICSCAIKFTDIDFKRPKYIPLICLNH